MLFVRSETHRIDTERLLDTNSDAIVVLNEADNYKVQMCNSAARKMNIQVDQAYSKALGEEEGDEIVDEVHDEMLNIDMKLFSPFDLDFLKE